MIDSENKKTALAVALAVRLGFASLTRLRKNLSTAVA
jgi:hypothetical protein